MCLTKTEKELLDFYSSTFVRSECDSRLST